MPGRIRPHRLYRGTYHKRHYIICIFYLRYVIRIWISATFNQNQDPYLAKGFWLHFLCFRSRIQILDHNYKNWTFCHNVLDKDTGFRIRIGATLLQDQDPYLDFECISSPDPESKFRIRNIRFKLYFVNFHFVLLYISIYRTIYYSANPL